MPLNQFGILKSLGEAVYDWVVTKTQDPTQPGVVEDAAKANNATVVTGNGGGSPNTSPLRNEGNIKKYANLKTNTVSTQKNRDILYPGKITNSFFNMMEAGEKIYEPNVTDATGPYRAIVMSVYDAPSVDSVEGILTNLYSFPWETTKKTVIARINELHHAAIPMPAQFGNDDGEHQFFISMCDKFTSIKPINVKPGDIVLVDFKDRKNKKDGFLIEVITESDVVETGSEPSAQEASNTGGVDVFIPSPPPTLQRAGKGWNGDPTICGGNVYEYATCKTGSINGYRAKLHPTVYDNFERMVVDAQLAGIKLRPGDTYRREIDQKTGRNSNCTRSNCTDEEFYYGAAKGSPCKVKCDPSMGFVAKRGSRGGSRHLYGEAIDIAYINSSGNDEGAIAYKKNTKVALSSPSVSEEQKKAIKWLIQNSLNYSLYNFTGEAWHYSTDSY